jgi:hypothetical protein
MAVTGKVTGNQPILNMPGKGNSVADVSFNQWTLTNSGTTDATGIFGESSGARAFDGTNDKITSGTDVYDYVIDKLNASAVSIIYDIATNNTTNFWGTFYYQDTVLDGATVLAHPITPTLFIYLSGANTTANSVNANLTPVSSFQNYCATLKKETTNYTGVIYIDGVPIALNKSTSNQLVTKSVNASRCLTLGARPTMTSMSWFNGKICNHKAFQKVLTKNEVYILTRQKGRVNY